jgi:hypothetical protein
MSGAMDASTRGTRNMKARPPDAHGEAGSWAQRKEYTRAGQRGNRIARWGRKEKASGGLIPEAGPAASLFSWCMSAWRKDLVSSE